MIILDWLHIMNKIWTHDKDETAHVKIAVLRSLPLLFAVVLMGLTIAFGDNI